MSFLSVLFALKYLLSYVLLKQQLRQDYSWKPQQLQGSAVQNNLGLTEMLACWRLCCPSCCQQSFKGPISLTSLNIAVRAQKEVFQKNKENVEPKYNPKHLY